MTGTKCDGQIRLIAFIDEAIGVREILAHLGQPTSLPPMAPTRGPSLREMPDAAPTDCDPQAQPASDYEFDQRIAWSLDEDPISRVGERSCHGPPRQPRRPPR